MKQKTLSCITLLAALILMLVVALPAQAADAKKYVFKFASIYPPPDVSMEAEAAKYWMDTVTKRSKGRIKFKSFWGASLSAPAATIDLIKSGVVQAGQSFHWYTPGKFPLGDFEYVFPFGPADPVIVAKSLRQIRGEFKEFDRDDARANIIHIADPPGGAYSFMSNIPLRKLEDFKGQKVSLVGKYFGRWLPKGTTAVVRPMHDRYDLLRTGVVKIDFLPFEHFYAWKIPEVAKYYVSVDILGATFGPIFMNRKVFMSLPKDLQEIIRQAGIDTEMYMAKTLIPKWWKKVQEALKAKGVEMIDFPESEKARWVKQIADIPLEWALEVEAKGYPGRQIIKRWQEITTANGHKWNRKWGEGK